jgi:amidase
VQSPYLPDNDEVASASATVLARAIAVGKLSSSEIIDHLLARIDKIDPALHAFVTVDHGGARRQARAADDAVARGNPLGPLHGVPVSIKDCFLVEGLPATCGLPERLSDRSLHDAPAVSALRKAGAVIIGMTSTPPMLADIQTVNPLVGRTNNPYGIDRSAGGSSGGCGVAVAAGMGPLSLGSDLAGSTRVPAAWCGVAGLKPSHGIISKRDHIPGALGPYGCPDVSVTGPLGRTIDDLALALSVLAGPEPEHAIAWRVDLPPPRTLHPSELRVGLWSNDPACPISTATAGAVATAAEAFRQCGSTVLELDPFAQLAPLAKAFFRSTTAEITANLQWDAWEAMRTAPDDAPEVVRATAAVHAESHRAWAETEFRRQRFQATMADLFRSIDVLLCPIMPVPAILHDTERPPHERTYDLDGAARPYAELNYWCSIATLAHLPSVVLPVGLSPEGLPLAVQVIGPYLEDHTALTAASMLARALHPGTVSLIPRRTRLGR